MTTPQGPSLPPALVLGASETALATMRALGREGIICWGLCDRTHGPARASRYARRWIAVEGHDDASCRRALLGLNGEAACRPVLVPTSDATVLFLSRQRETLQPRFRFALPCHDLVMDLLDKERFAQLAARAKFPSPEGQRVTTAAEFEIAAETLGYPLVAKPLLTGSGLPKVMMMHAREEAEPARALLAARPGVALLVQRMIVGDDSAHVSVAAFLDDNSRAVAAFTSRKKRQTFVGAGVGVYVESAHDEEAEQLACRFLEAVGYVGVAEVELKRDARTGRLALIEVNPRLWVQTGLALACGINFPLMLYSLACGTPIPVPRRHVEHAAWQDALDDFYWTFRRNGYRAQGRSSMMEWVRDTWRARAHAYASLRDPMPGLRRMGQALAMVRRAAIRR